jgi:hypothetical protein
VRTRTRWQGAQTRERSYYCLIIIQRIDLLKISDPCSFQVGVLCLDCGGSNSSDFFLVNKIKRIGK